MSNAASAVPSKVRVMEVGFMLNATVCPPPLAVQTGAVPVDGTIPDHANVHGARMFMSSPLRSSHVMLDPEGNVSCPPATLLDPVGLPGM